MTHSNRIAIVTGASRGLGLVIARVLGNRGYSLVIGGRDRGALETAAADLSGTPQSCGRLPATSPIPPCAPR